MEWWLVILFHHDRGSPDDKHSSAHLIVPPRLSRTGSLFFLDAVALLCFVLFGQARIVEHSGTWKTPESSLCCKWLVIENHLTVFKPSGDDEIMSQSASNFD